MSEQNEQKETKKKKKRISAEKRFYLLTATVCAVALTAVIGIAIAVSGGSEANEQVGVNNGTNSGTVLPPDSNVDGDGDNNDGEQVIVTPEGMVMPIRSVSVLNDYGFFYNQSVNAYYRHSGIDFSAEAGTEVLAVESGVVESVYKDELLTGTEVVIDHGDGLKSVYRFVKTIDGLKVGDSVEKGEVIATVAEACGNEHKDGPHLHLEIIENGKNVDPNLHLTLEEK